MELNFEAAVQSLTRSAEPASNHRLNARLADVQALLGQDMAWIEQALGDAAADGTAPGTDAALHLLALGGKRVRPTAVLLAAACFGAVPTAAREVAVVVELIHSATLLHDDVVDDGDERRGAATSRRVWGNAVSVLAGDALLVQALQRTFEHAPELMADLLATLSQLVSGEIVQLRGRRELDLSETTYQRILRDKTASLFRFATRSGARLGGATDGACQALGEFGERLGIAFQLVDDAIDYIGEGTGKTLCADLLEGKVTLPLVLATEQNPGLLQTVERIRAGDHDQVVPLRAAVIASGACATVRDRARRETQLAVAALDAIDECPARSVLRAVARQLVDRDR